MKMKLKMRGKKQKKKQKTTDAGGSSVTCVGWCVSARQSIFVPLMAQESVWTTIRDLSSVKAVWSS